MILNSPCALLQTRILAFLLGTEVILITTTACVLHLLALALLAVKVVCLLRLSLLARVITELISCHLGQGAVVWLLFNTTSLFALVDGLEVVGVAARSLPLEFVALLLLGVVVVAVLLVLAGSCIHLQCAWVCCSSGSGCWCGGSRSGGLCCGCWSCRRFSTVCWGLVKIILLSELKVAGVAVFTAEEGILAKFNTLTYSLWHTLVTSGAAPLHTVSHTICSLVHIMSADGIFAFASLKGTLLLTIFLVVLITGQTLQHIRLLSLRIGLAGVRQRFTVAAGIKCIGSLTDTGRHHFFCATDKVFFAGNILTFKISTSSLTSAFGRAVSESKGLANVDEVLGVWNRATA